MYHNDCYYLGANKKLLKEKALEIKNEWLKEAEEELNKIREIVI